MYQIALNLRILLYLTFNTKSNQIPRTFFKAVSIDLWPYLLTTKHSYAQLFKWGHSIGYYGQSGEKDIDWKRELEFPFPKRPPSWENPLSWLFHELTMKVRSILVVRILATILTKFSWTWKFNFFQTLHFSLKKNGILLPKLFWPTVRKNCSSDQEKLLKFEAEGWEFAKFLRSLEQFIQTVKGQNNFW